MNKKITKKLVTFGKKNKVCMVLALLCVCYLYAVAVIMDKAELVWKAMFGKTGRRVAAVLLSVCMIFTLLPATAFAAESEGIAIDVSGVTNDEAMCENHTEHKEECGYIATVEAQPCAHLNEDGSYSCLDSSVSRNVTELNNTGDVCTHTDSCGYAEGINGVSCTHECELCSDADKDIIADACICEALCAESLINSDCPACATGGVDFAAVCKGDSGVVLSLITGFAPLDEEIRTQRVGADDLVLPETLLATVDGEEIELPVTWDGLSTVNEARKTGGFFALTANVGEGYTLAEGVTAPTISAMILGMGRGTSGTADDPYLVSTVDQLIYLGTLVSQNDSTYNASDKHFKLTADLDLKGQAWTPIGGGIPFKTNFDGDGHTIKGLTINQPTMDYVGLFGNATGEIKNIKLTKVNVTGKDYVGGVVGNGSTVTNCCVTGTIKGNSRVGGVAGQVDANVLDCYSTGTVTGNTSDIGGVVGHVGKNISSSYSTSTVFGTDYVGGVAGQVVGKVSNCATLNSVITVSGTAVGRVAGAANTFDNCYAFAGMKVSSSTVAGGAVDNKNGADMTKAKLRTAIWWKDTAKLSTASWEFVNDNIPALKTTGGTLMSGQETDLPIYLTELPAPISAAEKLVSYLNTTYGAGTVEIAAGDTNTVVLKKNITLTDTITIAGDLTLDTKTFTITGKVGINGANGSDGISITSPAAVTITGSGGIVGGDGGTAGNGGNGVVGSVTLSGSAAIIGGKDVGGRQKAVTGTITAGTTDTVILGGNNADSVTTPITSGSSSNYGYIKAQTVYAITKVSTTNGSFTVKVGTNEVTHATEGDIVTITPTADSGYEVDAVTVTKTSDSTAVTVTNNTFTMPAYEVTVSVTFKSNAPTDSFAVNVVSTVGGTSSNSFYTITSATSPNTTENQPAYAAEGETVTVALRTTQSSSGSQAVSLNVAGIPVARRYDNPNQFTFTMPAQAVDLTITFGDKNTVFARQYYDPKGTATPPSADGATAAVSYTSAVLLTGADDAQFSPAPGYTIDGYLYKFSDGNDYGTVDVSGTHLVYTPNTAAANKTISIFIKAYSRGGVSGAIEHKVTVGAVPVPDYNKDASLSALTYQITDGASGSVTLQANQYEYTVELPFGTAIDKVVTLTPTLNDFTAAITAQTTGNTTYGTLNGVALSDIATVTVTAQDPSVIKVYKVSFLIKEPDVPYSVTNKDTGTAYQDGDTITISTGDTVKLRVNHGSGTGGAGAFHYAVEDTSIVYSAPGAGTGIYPNTMHLVTLESKKVGNTKFVVQFYTEQTTDFVGKTPIDTITLNLVSHAQDIAAAKTAAENANYGAVSQADCTDENAAKAYVENIAKTAVNNDSITVVATQVNYTSPTAGTSGNPNGSNGSYEFTITVSKGDQNETTTKKTLTITATPYTLPTHKPVSDITGIPTAATANVPLLLTGTVNPADATNKTIVWSVKTAGDTGGTITGNTLNTTAAGTVVVTATIVNGAGAITDYTQDVTITVSTTPTTYTITASAGTGGSISPSGSVTVTNGGSQSFTISASSGYSISSVIVDGVNQGAIGAYTFSNVTAGHTISANFSYNGGGSGGNSGSSSGSGSSGGSVVVTPQTPDKPNTPTESEIKIPGTVDGNGNATATVTDKAVSDAIKQAEDTARKNGNLDNGITLVLNVDTGSKTATSVSVNLPKVTQETILSKKIVSTVLVVNNPDIQIGIDLAAVEAINTQAKSDVSITATRMDNTKLIGEAKTAIGNRPVFDLKATYQNGSKSVTNFGGGSVSVAFPYTLQEREVAGGLYAVYVDGVGKVSYITNSSYDAQNKVLRFATNHFSVYGIGYKSPASFADIESHWAKADIEFVANRALMNGTSNTTFSPNGATSRGMFVTMLGRLAGIDSTKYANTKFSDVSATSYYAPYVAWATEKGITVGTSATTFGPDKIVTRQEMAVFMARYAKAMNYKVPQTREAITFADNSSIGSWAAAEVRQMQMAGIVNGKNSNRFDPTGTVTRGETAALLHRYVELVIDPATAQGLEINDSGSTIMYENGRQVKSQSRSADSRTYAFNGYGEAALPIDNKKYLLHTVQKNEYFYVISRMYGCTQEEIMALNGLRMGDVIHPGDVLKVPQA